MKARYFSLGALCATLVLLGIWGLSRYPAAQPVEAPVQPTPPPANVQPTPPPANQESQSQELLQLQAENDRLKLQLIELTAQLDASQAHPQVQLHNLAQLKAQGLLDPAADLIASLKQRTDLIPMEGTLGGTMQFSQEGSWLLTDKWVIAFFDDGHRGGTLLLAYTVEDGKIQWERLGFVPH